MITIDGPAEQVAKFHERIAARSSKWLTEAQGDLKGKFEWLLDAPLVHARDDNAIAQPHDICAICYAELPEISNEDRIDCACNNSFHHRCLVEWSQTLPGTRLSFRRIFTNCPNCDGPLVILAK